MLEAETPEAVVRWLSAGGPWPQPPTVIQTHAALVFLAGDRAFKMKRAVDLGYLDFSTLGARHAVLARELELNRRTAPRHYLRLVAVTREADGLALAGRGVLVEWLLEMQRFPDGSLLDERLDRGLCGEGEIERLARAVAAFHDREPVVRGVDWPTAVARIMRENAADLGSLTQVFAHGDVAAEGEVRQALLTGLDAVLSAQSADVRHCHGDLHLGNVFLDGDRPTLFDCIEFNDFYARIPPLYDFSFLLMDLLGRQQRRLANRALNTWVLHRAVEQWPDVIASLRALTLYLLLRAEIRAKVEARRPRGADAARGYLRLAAGFLQGRAARLVAIGGFSGTGKSTLARALAPDLGGACGALHLRTDEIRKRLAGEELDARLPPAAYTPEASRRVYGTLLDLARRAVDAGQAVIVDGVFERPDERDEIAAVAKAAGARFDGFWLEAPADVLRARVAGRRGDVSDADVAVLERQLGYETGAIGWRRLDVSGTAEDAARKAFAALMA
jgi:aminoglycoside phosphotransferase family enzyme/predicted kinase